MFRDETYDTMDAYDPFEPEGQALHRIFNAIVLATLVAAPITLYVVEGLSLIHRLWIAFLFANLLVWTVVLLVGAGRGVARGFAIGRLLVLRRRRTRREHVSEAELALE